VCQERVWFLWVMNQQLRSLAPKENKCQTNYSNSEHYLSPLTTEYQITWTNHYDWPIRKQGTTVKSHL